MENWEGSNGERTTKNTRQKGENLGNDNEKENTIRHNELNFN